MNDIRYLYDVFTEEYFLIPDDWEIYFKDGQWFTYWIDPDGEHCYNCSVPIVEAYSSSCLELHVEHDDFLKFVSYFKFKFEGDKNE